jgi:hypothetical protein
MKPQIAACAAICVVILGGTAAYAQSTTVTTPGGNTTTEVTNTGDGQTVITVTVNNQQVPFDKNDEPVMINGRVMVPLRGVVERLGGTIQYDAATRVITGAQANLEKQFRLRVGSNQAVVNGQQQTLDTFAREVHGVTYVPLRFVSEALGADVRWDSAKRVVTIMADGYNADVKTASKPKPVSP